MCIKMHDCCLYSPIFCYRNNLCCKQCHIKYGIPTRGDGKSTVVLSVAYTSTLPGHVIVGRVVSVVAHKH